ncbi:hypothetical protein ES703_66690 [subsurface metagenome]
MENTCLSIDEIENFLGDLAANKVAIFFDTYQSGSAARSIGLIAMSRGLDERKAIAALAKQAGIIEGEVAFFDGVRNMGFINRFGGETVRVRRCCKFGNTQGGYYLWVMILKKPSVVENYYSSSVKSTFLARH